MIDANVYRCPICGDYSMAPRACSRCDVDMIERRHESWGAAVARLSCEDTFARGRVTSVHDDGSFTIDDHGALVVVTGQWSPSWVRTGSSPGVRVGSIVEVVGPGEEKTLPDITAGYRATVQALELAPRPGHPVHVRLVA
jgi:hypothetical protein